MPWTSALIAAFLLQAPGGDTGYGPYEAPATAAAPEGLTSVVPQYYATPTPSRSVGFKNYWPRFGLQHRSQGYGYDRGFTSLEAFVPVFQSDFSSLAAIQANGIYDNGGEWGANLGLVYRRYLDGWDRTIGGNVFYDYRDQSGNDFNQIGIGVETLGSYVDWRMNGYVPVGDDIAIPEGSRITDAFFSGRSILINFLGDKALAGFDTELGGILPSTGDRLRGYAGLYHFQGPQSDDVVGVQARLECRLYDMTVLQCGVTNDGTFGTNVVLAAGFYFPGFAPKNQPPGGRAAARLGEMVYRNYNITIERSPLKDPIPAQWTDGSQIDVVHVDSLLGPPGTGALLDPVHSLTAAQAQGVPGSIIYARANSTFTNEGIALQNGQQLLGEGIEHTIHSYYGDFILPQVTDDTDVLAVPTISNAPGNTVTMANNTVLSGFQILNPGASGVVGDNLTDVVVDRVRVSGAAVDGIRLSQVNGDVQVTESFVVNNGGVGIDLALNEGADPNGIVVSDNTVLQNGAQGIRISTSGDSTNTLLMERNLARVSLGPIDNRGLAIVEINTFDSSRLSARIEDNDVEDSFARDDTSPDEDPYYHQWVLNAANNSRVDFGFIDNRLVSNRQPFSDNAANGSFGLDLNSSDVSALRARVASNSSSLNYAIGENFISVFQLEDVLSTNSSGTFYYFPTANQIEVISDGAIDLP